MHLISRGHARLLIAVATAVLGALVPLSASFAAGPQNVTIKATEFSFAPDRVTLTVGQPVQITIVNDGKVDHDLKSDLPIANLSYQKASNPADEQKDNAAQGVLDVDFDAGTTAQVTFTPTKAGTYVFHCDVAGHTEAGMKGAFVVVAASAADAPVAGAANTSTKAIAAQTLPKAGAPLGAPSLPWLAVGGLLLVGAGIGGRRRSRRSRDA